MALLEIEGLSVRYGKALAIENLSMQIVAGEIVAVLGPNGAGKSSLLKAISGSVERSGRISFEGHNIGALRVDRVVAQGICHCPEGRRLFPELTVRQNLELGAYLRHSRDAISADRELVFELFPVLRERAGQQASTLSGGEQQMLAIGRSLMGGPHLLLLDEPSVGIAHRLKLLIFEAIRRIRDRGTTILLVEQDARSALAITDRAYVLEHGAIALAGSAAELSGNDYIRRAYLGI